MIALSEWGFFQTETAATVLYAQYIMWQPNVTKHLFIFSIALLIIMTQTGLKEENYAGDLSALSSFSFEGLLQEKRRQKRGSEGEEGDVF